MNKFKVGDIIIVSASEYVDVLIKSWVKSNPLRVGRVCEIGDHPLFPIIVKSYTGEELICNEDELTLVEGDE